MASNSEKIRAPENAPSVPAVETSGTAPGVDTPLARIVEESKARLAEEDQKSTRGRGRPPGTKNKPPVDGPERTYAPSPPPAPEIEPQDAMDMTPALKLFIETPFKIRAKRFKFKEYELEDEESTMLAQQWNGALAPFLPTVVNSKWGAISLCALSTAIIVLTKESELADHRARLAAHARAQAGNEAQPTVTPEAPVSREDPDLNLPPVSSANFFPNQ